MLNTPVVQRRNSSCQKMLLTRIIGLFLLHLPGLLLAQMPRDPESTKYTYQEVIEVSNISKDDLYTRARAWFVKGYKSANAVLQMDDRESGTIIGKGYFEVK